jgi:hypothetical protein
MNAEKGNVPFFRLFPESLSVPLPFMECISRVQALSNTHYGSTAPMLGGFERVFPL